MLDLPATRSTDVRHRKASSEDANCLEIRAAARRRDLLCEVADVEAAAAVRPTIWAYINARR